MDSGRSHRYLAIAAVIAGLGACEGSVDWGQGDPPPVVDPATYAAQAYVAEPVQDQTPPTEIKADPAEDSATAQTPAPAAPVRALPLSALAERPRTLPELLASLTEAADETDPVPATGSAATADDDLSALRYSGEGVDPEMVRAPELFAASGLAEWNGRRTTRGVWVAHPRARGSIRVRIVNSQTGAEVDGMLYRPQRDDNGDIITLSSDTAAALGLEPRQPTLISLFGLRPKGATSRAQRRQVESSALGELASHVARMEDNTLLQLVAAAMRGMGYATVFEDGPPGGRLPAIRAFPRPDAGFQLPAIRVVVRPNGKAAMTAGELAEMQGWLDGSGDLAVIISIPGFRADAERGLDRLAEHVQLVDLDGLLNIWLTHYEQLSEPDRALMPLQPVFFLARG